LKPGYGFGGPCFPRDNRAFGQYAESIGVEALLPRATDDYNRMHARYMADEFLKLDMALVCAAMCMCLVGHRAHLSGRLMTAARRQQYTFEDVAYKERSSVPIIEESQKLLVAELLVRSGKRVLIRDRKMIIDEVRRTFGRMFEYEITDQQA
jgi:UDPglucose 6-dehydrogenase